MTDLSDAIAAVNALVSRYGLTRDQMAEVLTGPADGGPDGDGYYPVTLADGSSTIKVPSPRKIADLPAGVTLSVATIAELQGLTAAAVGQRAMLGDGSFVLTAGAPAIADPGHGVSIPLDSARYWARTRSEPRSFNAAWWGAKGTNADETVPINRALARAAEEGVAEVILPGRHQVTNVVVPPYTANPKQQRSLTLRGTGAPSLFFGTVPTGAVLNQDSSMLVSTATSGAIFAVPPSDGPLGFDSYNIDIRDLIFRAGDNPQVQGVNLNNAQMASLSNVQVDNGVYSAVSSQPTHGTCGIFMPRSGNAAVSRLTNVSVNGFDQGLSVEEHTRGDYLNFTACNIGMLIQEANDSSSFGRIATQCCPRGIAVNGHHYFSIQDWMIEHQSDNPSYPQWQQTIEDFRDFGNAARGTINYLVTKGDVGILPDKNGGSDPDMVEDRYVKNGDGSYTVTRADGLIVTSASLMHLVRTGSGPTGPYTFYRPNITGTAVSITSAAQQTISFNNYAAARNFVRKAGDNSTLVCVRPGFYQLEFKARFAPGGGSVRGAYLYINGNSVPAQRNELPPLAGRDTIVPLGGRAYFSYGDVINVNVMQDSGGSLDMRVDNDSGNFIANWLSPGIGALLA